MKKMLLGILILFVAGGLWFLTAHSAKHERMVDEATRKKILLMHEGTEPRTLDPALSQGVPEHHTIMALMEGLVSYNPDDQNKDDPGVADHWEHNADYSVWDFYLRNNARWSNGDPVTANDFIFAYKRNLTSTLGSPYVDLLFILKNAREYFEGKIKDFGQVGVKAIDSHHLRLELIGPTPYLLSDLVNDIWFPVHPATILKFGRMDERDTKWTRPGNYVGNGAFQLKVWKPNDVIEMVKNPNYWDAANVKLNGINIYSIENEDTLLNAFRAGQLHLTWGSGVPLDKVPYYRRVHPELLQLCPYQGVYFYKINVERKGLDNPKVRLALNLAIDRKALIKNVLRRGELPATGVTPPGMAGYPVLDVMHYDPKRARKLMAEAGFPNGKGFPKFDILTNTNQAHRIVAEVIQQMWKTELNINVGIVNQEWKVFMDSQNSMNYDLSRLGWIGDFMDPVTFLGIWTTGNGNNNTHWSNPVYDQLLAKAAVTGDPKERMGILRQAEQLFLSEPPVVLIYYYTTVRLKDPSVRNWNDLAEDDHNYKYIDLVFPSSKK
jgi:oligopeptide transport system substrate-binding protein